MTSSPDHPGTAMAHIATTDPAAQTKPARMPNSADTSVTATMQARPMRTGGTACSASASEAPAISTEAHAGTQRRPDP